MKTNREVWLIDNHNMTLFRKTSDGEKSIILLSSPQTRQFMCITSDEFKKIVDQLVTADGI